MGGRCLVVGYGINDVDYAVTKSECTEGYTKSGQRKMKLVWICPYYQKWKKILERVYSEKWHKSRPTYIGASVCKEWLYLTNFIKWVDSQPEREWERMQPDKDLLIEGNKHYSPETVVFIKGNVNTFITDNAATRGKYMIGVSYGKSSKTNPFNASCNDPLKRKSGYIGCYHTDLEAHLAWKETKRRYALELAEVQSDPRIAEVLRNKYN